MEHETDHDIDVHEKFREALSSLDWFGEPVPEGILDQTLFSSLPGETVRRHEIEDAREQLSNDPDVIVTKQDSAVPEYEFRSKDE